MKNLIDLVSKIVNDKINETINEIFLKLDNNDFRLSEEINSYHDKFNKIFLETFEKIFRNYDNYYFKNLRTNNIKVTHIKSKTVRTEYGDFKLERRRYIDTVTKEKFYYIDDLIDIDKRQRIEKAFEYSILEQSIKKSYKSVEKRFNNNVTATTAINIAKRNINKIEEIEKKIHKRNIKEIFIEADEDHVHLRNKTNLQVKLVYVHEGYSKNILTNKNELINPKYFSDTDKDIWKDVKEYILKTYDEDVKITINGDGARWIKQSIKFFKNSKFFLDKFHIKSSIELISSSNKQKEELYKAIRSNKDIRKYEIHKVFLKYNQDLHFLKKPKFYSDRWEYLIFNSDYIDVDNIHSHCSAESHISHVLSDRMSSRPMAWTKDGARRMGKLRAFLFNHENIDILKTIS